MTTTALVIKKTDAQYLIIEEVADYLKEQYELAGREMDADTLAFAERYRRALETAYYDLRSALSDTIRTTSFLNNVRFALQAERLYISNDVEESLFVERFRNFIKAVREASFEKINK